MSDGTAPAGLKRDTTMEVTAQEGGAFLERAGNKPDDDAKTRGMQKKLDEIQEEEAPPKPKVSRTTTMAATAQERAELLGDEKLGKTRGEKSSPRKSPHMKRTKTTQATTQDAAAILEGQSLGRTRSQTKGISPARTTPSPKKPAKKAAMKKEGTMAVTAKEGQEFLERSGKKDAAGDSKDEGKEGQK